MLANKERYLREREAEFNVAVEAGVAELRTDILAEFEAREADLARREAALTARERLLTEREELAAKPKARQARPRKKPATKTAAPTTGEGTAKPPWGNRDDDGDPYGHIDRATGEEAPDEN